MEDNYNSDSNSDTDELDEIISELDKPKKTRKNKEEYYVDPKMFKEAIVTYYETEDCTVYLGGCLNKIAEGLGYNGKFINYCVDQETEALTKRGWLKYNEISVDDTILSYNTENKQLVWSNILDVYTGEYDGLMFKLSNEGLDALVTPNHKFVSLEDGIKPIEQFNTNDHLVLMGDYVGIHDNNIVDPIEELLKTDNINLKLNTILNLTQEERLSLIRSCICNDNTYISTDNTLMNNFVILCTISGFTTITEYDEITKKYTVMYTRTKNVKPFNDIDLNGGVVESGNVPTVQYNGTIWCPQTEYGTWVCRRGRNVYVTGNSYKEDMIGDALIKMFSALKRKKFDVNSPSSPFGYFTTIAFHAFINRIKKEKKHFDALCRFREMKYEEEMSVSGSHVYIKPILDSTGDDAGSFDYDN